MLKHKLFVVIIHLMCTSLNGSDDFFSKFHQNDYKIEFQRTEVIDYDKSVLNIFKVKTFKYNRTFTAVNATINSKINMSNEIEIRVQAYKYLSNEYRILPGFRFQVNLCKTIKENIAGLQIVYKCGNVASCEIIRERTYEACNMHPDESRLPPFLPNGEYKFQMEFIDNDKIIVTFAFYMKVYRPIPIPGRH